MATVDTEKTDSASADEEKLVGLLAEFDGPDALMKAAEKVRDAGYKKWDTHAPFPIHGMDEAMGIKRTILPFIVGGAALTGFLTALGLQWFTNGFDYPLILSGKNPFTLPSSIPVMFELSVLFAAFGALLGMLGLNGLPMFYQPLFKTGNFEGATDDKFFLTIDSADKDFDEDKARDLLGETGAINIDAIMAPSASPAIPKPILGVMGLLVLLAFVPLLVMLRARYVTYDYAKLHIVQDMDAQPKWKAQTKSPIFSDLRIERPEIEGTVARGELEYALNPNLYNEGTTPDSVTKWIEPKAQPTGGEDPKKKPEGSAEVRTAPIPVGAQNGDKKPANDKKPGEGDKKDPAGGGKAAPPPKVEVKDWVTEFPMPVTDAMMKRGQQRFNIYCSVCHGFDGAGKGTAALRGAEVSPQTWAKPIGLTTEGVVKQPVGRLYETITNGRGRMPPYKAQIPFEDRWAIVLYLRALQRSQNATEADTKVSTGK